MSLLSLKFSVNKKIFCYSPELLMSPLNPLVCLLPPWQYGSTLNPGCYLPDELIQGNQISVWEGTHENALILEPILKIIRAKQARNYNYHVLFFNVYHGQTA